MLGGSGLVVTVSLGARDVFLKEGANPGNILQQMVLVGKTVNG